LERSVAPPAVGEIELQVPILVLFGIGCGELVRILNVRLPATVQLMVFEPDIALLAEVRAERHDLKSLADKRLLLFSDLSSLCLRLSACAIELNVTHTLVTPAYASVYPNLVEEFKTRVQESCQTAGALVRSSNERQQRSLAHFLANLSRRVELPITQTLRKLFAGRAAVIVSAGPSLDKNIAQLAALRDRVVIIAMNSSLGALRKQGLWPHVLVSMESESTSADLIGRQDCHLVLGDTSHPDTVAIPSRGTYLYQVIDPYRARFNMQVFDKNEGGLETGPCVANMALNQAALMGCSPIILIGQDLSRTGGRAYASGTRYSSVSFEDEGEQGHFVYPEGFGSTESEGNLNRYQRQSDVVLRMTDVPAWDGKGTIRTTLDHALFRSWFSDHAQQITAETRTVFVNATEGGVWIDNFQHLTLAEAERCFLAEAESFNATAILDQHWQHAPRVTPENLTAILSDRRRRISHFRAFCGRLITRVDRILAEGEQPQLLETYQRLTQAMGSHIEPVPLVIGVCEAAINEINNRQVDTVEQQYQNAREMYQLLHDSCDLILGAL